MSNNKHLLNNAHQSAKQAITRIIELEGGYVNDPNDKGGETKFGITKRWYPNLDIASLTRDDATRIYYQDYWLENQCDKLPTALAFILFDTAVNQGPVFAVTTLQNSLGVKADGIIGSQTLNAAYRVITDTPNVAISFTHQRLQRYASLAQNDPTQVKFIKGWINRAMEALSAGLSFRGEL